MNIYHFIYCLPLQNIVIVMLLAVIIWAGISMFLKQKHLQYINILGFVFSVCVIFYATILGRTVGTTNELILTPFYSFTEAKIQPEIYHSILMNCFIFVPFGLSIPFALPKNAKHKIIISIISAVIFSVAIELVQYKFSLGRAEVDDVLCNTFGAAIGTISYLSFSIYTRRINIEKAQ